MTFWPIFYLITATAVLSVSALSRDNVKFWLAVLLMWSWTLANFCVWKWGYADAPDAMAWAQLALMIAAAAVGHANQSYIALIIVALFGAQLTIQVGSRLTGSEGSYLFYASLNVLYLLQLIVVGASSATASLRRLWAGHIAHRPLGVLGAHRAHK